MVTCYTSHHKLESGVTVTNVVITSVVCDVILFSYLFILLLLFIISVTPLDPQVRRGPLGLGMAAPAGG